MIKFLLVALGGGLGSVLRYLIALTTYRVIDKTFPYGTLIVNACGSFFIGIAFILLLDHLGAWGDYTRAFVIVGFLGGFTTFSSFSLDTLILFENGEIIPAFYNIFISIFVCLALTYFGMWLARFVVSS